MRGSHCLQDKVDSRVLYKVGANFLASSPTILPSQLNIELLVLQLVQSTFLHFSIWSPSAHHLWFASDVTLLSGKMALCAL